MSSRQTSSKRRSGTTTIPGRFGNHSRAGRGFFQGGEELCIIASDALELERRESTRVLRHQLVPLVQPVELHPLPGWNGSDQPEGRNTDTLGPGVAAASTPPDIRQRALLASPGRLYGRALSREWLHAPRKSRRPEDPKEQILRPPWIRSGTVRPRKCSQGAGSNASRRRAAPGFRRP